MKKLILLTIIVVLTNFTFAQLQRIHKDNFSMNAKETYMLKSKSLIWNWDTIITYDTLGSKNRATRIYDSYGNILISLGEHWQTNTWLNNSRTTNT